MTLMHAVQRLNAACAACHQTPCPLSCIRKSCLYSEVGWSRQTSADRGADYPAVGRHACMPAWIYGGGYSSAHMHPGSGRTPV